MIRKLAIVIALLAGAVFLGANFYQNGLSYEPLASMRQAVESPEAGRAAEAKSTGGWGAEIVQDNLFDPDRAEPPKAAVGDKAPAPVAKVEEKVPPKIDLNGIILNQYGELVAYLAINGTAPRQARKGDTLDEIRVLDVTNKNVELRWDDTPISLTMEKIRTLNNAKPIPSEVPAK